MIIWKQLAAKLSVREFYREQPLILMLRFFSEVAYQHGTVLTLIFWIVPFVVIPEMTNEDWGSNLKIYKLPKITLIVVFISLIVITISFYWRESIFSESINDFQNIKRSYYLLNPLALIGWWPFLKASQKKNFIKLFTLITFSLFLCLTIPKVIEVTFLGDFLNNLTAHLSALISGLFIETQPRVVNNFVYIDTVKIKVGSGCSSTPQIIIILFSSLSLYICCRIKSTITTVIYTVLAIIIAFLINSIRISILTRFILGNHTEKFDFWHHGAGSLMFSFITMFITCTIYYLLWTKENPEKKSDSL